MPKSKLKKYSSCWAARVIFLATTAISMISAGSVNACTSGIFAASTTRDGRPLLWKHRDTSAVDNKVEYIPSSEGALAYVALFNASDKECKEAWTGFNSAGFAIMNTASYNLKDDDVPEKEMDREGFVMTLALQHCRTISDFASLLDSLPRPLGVEANFGVIDASGEGAFFETNNHSYICHLLSESPSGALIRTNYSHSGRPEEGFGYIREENAEYLLSDSIAAGRVSPEFLTERVSRSFYHSLHGRDFLDEDCQTGTKWAIDQDFIPRYKSSAVIVIEGCVPGDRLPTADAGRDYVMWTGLGYPPCSEIFPVECRPDGVDNRLQGRGPEGHAELSDIAKARRDEVFPRKFDNGDKYIDLSRLYNGGGTGYLQILVPQNLESYDRYRRSKRR